MITWWMTLGGNLPPGHEALLFDKWHGIFYMPSHTDTAEHTKAFDYPVTQTRLDIPRPLITQWHRHDWTYQDLWLPSHTDTAGHTKTFDYPVTQTLLDIPRPFITQSHRHGWTYQGLYLPSHRPLGGMLKSSGMRQNWTTYGATVDHTNHQTTTTTLMKYSLYLAEKQINKQTNKDIQRIIAGTSWTQCYSWGHANSLSGVAGTDRVVLKGWPNLSIIATSVQLCCERGDVFIFHFYHQKYI